MSVGSKCQRSKTSGTVNGKPYYNIHKQADKMESMVYFPVRQANLTALTF